MLAASPHTLKLLAALLWYSGVIVLAIKSGRLFIEAEHLAPGLPWLWVAIGAGLLLGAIKAKFLFGRLCLKNLRRIEGLEHPRIWQFYRPQFFIFLFAMVILGGYLSRLAHGDYPLLLSVALIELSIAVALFGSGRIFWQR